MEPGGALSGTARLPSSARPDAAPAGGAVPSLRRPRRGSEQPRRVDKGLTFQLRGDDRHKIVNRPGAQSVQG